MSRYIKTFIAVAVVALILNDGGRWAQSTIELRNATGAVLDQAVIVARHSDQAQLSDYLAQQAAIQGIRVTQFAMEPTGLHIWSNEDVKGTWVIGPYLAMSKGVPFAKAWSVPVTVSYDSEEAIR